MLVTTLEANPFLGRVLTGRIRSGSVRANQPVKALSRDGSLVENGRLSKVLAFRGLDRQAVEEAQAGDIIAISGLVTATVADTICDLAVEEPISAQPIDPPTLTMTFRINDGPLPGKRATRFRAVLSATAFSGRPRVMWRSALLLLKPRPMRSRSPAAASCSSEFSSKPCVGRVSN